VTRCRGDETEGKVPVVAPPLSRRSPSVRPGRPRRDTSGVVGGEGREIAFFSLRLLCCRPPPLHYDVSLLFPNRHIDRQLGEGVV
jgi:hypothetical protein